ncbi:hypothetical protein LINPERPRIM_LOCUS3037, partial [Linum perenne]
FDPQNTFQLQASVISVPIPRRCLSSSSLCCRHTSSRCLSSVPRRSALVLFSPMAKTKQSKEMVQPKPQQIENKSKRPRRDDEPSRNPESLKTV